jgi:cell division protein ZapA (FtsZ GTPase activity inhibitor)
VVHSNESVFTVELFGQTFRFQYDAGDVNPNEVLEILYRETKRIETEQRASASYSNKMALLVMAALNVCLENVELKKSKEELIRDFLDQSQKIIQILDANID